MNIGWISAIDPSGYSSCARSYIKALYKNKNCKVNSIITNVALNINLEGIDKKEIDFLSSIAIKDFSKVDFLVNHCVPDRMMLSFKRKNILYTVCEMEIPERWVNICNSCDIIMTASEFSKRQFVNSGVKENIIHIIPHCHDEEIWNPKVKSLNIKNKTDFNFLFIGDYTPRKGGDLLIKSFIKAFEGNKNVSLTLKSYFNSFSVKHQKELIDRILTIINNSGVSESKRPKIFFYGNPIDECLMPRFMNSFDCLVSPHHGEGFGLAMSQMMFLGKPTISTNYSGNLQFMTEENSYLIDTCGLETVDDEMAKINPNFEGKKWIKINEESLIECMRNVVYNQGEALEKGEKAFDDMKKRFSSKVVSNQIIKLFNNEHS